MNFLLGVRLFMGVIGSILLKWKQNSDNYDTDSRKLKTSDPDSWGHVLNNERMNYRDIYLTADPEAMFWTKKEWTAEIFTWQQIFEQRKNELQRYLPDSRSWGHVLNKERMNHRDIYLTASLCETLWSGSHVKHSSNLSSKCTLPCNNRYCYLLEIVHLILQIYQ